MKFLFLTDYHGNHKAYKEAFAYAEVEKCDAIVNAGDALPKGFDHNTPFAAAQRKWWETWYVPKLDMLRDKGIRVYMMFGNDDAGSNVYLMDEAEDKGLLVRIDRPLWTTFGEYHIIGMPWVCDYPFSLKDWCCGDEDTQPCMTQFGPRSEPTPSGLSVWKCLGRW